MNKWYNYGKWRHPEKRKELMKNMNKNETYSIPIHENGIKTEWTVDGVVGDEKYFQLLELGNGKNLPDMINTTTTKKQEETMTEEELQNFPQMISSKMAAQQQLINLLYSQVVDLTMMSKIELGDDVIAEIKRLNEIING
jgi:hypothetical protein